MKELATEVAAVKAHKETRVEYMTLLMELKRQRKEGWQEGRAEGKAEGIAEGEQLRSEAVALDMLRDNEPLSRIIKYARLSKEQIQNLAQAHHLPLTEG